MILAFVVADDAAWRQWGSRLSWELIGLCAVLCLPQLCAADRQQCRF